MTTDVLPDPQTVAAGSGIRSTVASTRRRNLTLFALGAAAVVALVATFLPGADSSRASGTQLTHTIARGDLIVTVTEQGTLESSNNTEIKCKVRGNSTVLWVIEAGTEVAPGYELVRLDTSTIEDNINAQEIVYQRAVATHAQSEADVAVAEIAITEYLEGVYRSQMKTLEKDLAIAQSNLRTAQNMLEHSTKMFKRGYVSELEVEGNEFTVEQAKLELELKRTEIDVLKRFTKAKELETLKSTLKAATAKLASDKAALDLEKARLDRERKQLENCVIKADATGMVILPSAAEWKSAPDIEEGATVREDQVLLMIPDLTQMQVKVGIHESMVDRIDVGMPAKVTLLENVIDGEVASIATVTKPAGWWTGNVVKYDTIISVDSQEGLKPGMSVEVEIILAKHTDVLTIPVAAVVETEDEYLCWVETPEGVERRSLQLGDSNDQFIVVEAGLKEGDDVILNPIAFVDEAQFGALKPLDQNKKAADESTDSEAQPAVKKTQTGGAKSKPSGEKGKSEQDKSESKPPKKTGSK